MLTPTTKPQPTRTIPRRESGKSSGSPSRYGRSLTIPKSIWKISSSGAVKLDRLYGVRHARSIQNILESMTTEEPGGTPENTDIAAKC